MWVLNLGFGLNPFLIRATFERGAETGPQGGGRLNPFLIRATFEREIRIERHHVLAVLIPF